jgi:hypothetical protein
MVKRACMKLKYIIMMDVIMEEKRHGILTQPNNQTKKKDIFWFSPSDIFKWMYNINVSIDSHYN